MTNITESEFDYDHTIGEGSMLIIYCESYQDFQNKKQQILQNQKDAQELARIKGDLKHCYKRYQEQLDITIQFRQEKEKLQSQHKKLVDVIQNRIKSKVGALVGEVMFHNGDCICQCCNSDEYPRIRDAVDALDQELQNLLKESEKE